ncbi:MFS transporter [Dinoroseobacter sp. S124A]|uniref:MFS transporter n=1 Tax=Dinoroseobacter sp. S124A TaxID=3415128 RepID=UPI003C798A77
MAHSGFLRSNARWLGAGGLLAFSSSYGQTFFISIFAGEIQASFSLSHGAWGAIYASGTLAAAAVMVWLGALTDQHRARSLGPWAMGGLACACLAMALNPWVWMLPVFVFALRLSGQGMLSHISRVAIARWFTATRGKAIAVSSLGFSIGEALLPLIFVALLTVAPWRELWVLTSALALLTIPPLRLLLQTERTPQSFAATYEATGLGNRHWSRTEVLRSPLFWGLVPGLIAPPALITAFFFQQVHLAEAKGLPHLELVALFPLYSALSVLAMLSTGALIDRVGSMRLMPLYLLPLALGFLILAGAQSIWTLSLGIGLMAVTAGANNALPAAFWADSFGTRHLGAIKAVATALMVVGSAIGPLFTGFGIDAGFGFPTQMPWISLYILASILLLTLSLRRLQATAGLARPT